MTEKPMAFFQDGIGVVMDELEALMVSKQKDYGPGNIMAFGEFGVLVRLNDKVERLKNLFKKGAEPCNESVEDTWKDIANYAIIALMLRRGSFLLPLAEDIHTSSNCARRDCDCIVDEPDRCCECKQWVAK